MKLRTGAKRRGFTLVEIIIVVLIIGVLLAIATPQFVSARDGSRAKTCQHNLMQILGAKERWAMDQNRGANDTPTDGMLTPYYTRSTPICPARGTYTINALRDLPTCSVGGVSGQPGAHVLW